VILVISQLRQLSDPLNDLRIEDAVVGFLFPKKTSLLSLNFREPESLDDLTFPLRRKLLLLP
jgi:hypothetical protein